MRWLIYFGFVPIALFLVLLALLQIDNVRRGRLGGLLGKRVTRSSHPLLFWLFATLGFAWLLICSVAFLQVLRDWLAHA